MKIMVAIPCFDHMDVSFVQCLAKLEKVGQTDICFHSSSLIYDARNQLAMKAINEKYDYVLWLDSDMIFEPTLLKDLLNYKKECISAMYFNRRPPYKPAFFDVCDIEQTERKGEIKPVAHNYIDYPKDGKPFEVAAFGFGAVLMEVKFLDALIATYGLPFSPLAGFGEDLSFCLRWKRLDWKLWCAPIVVGHLSKVIVNDDTWEANKEEAIKNGID